MNGNNLSGYIDIHSHFLPGLDDGPEDYEQCIATAEQYVKIGVHCVIATPHFIHGTRWAASPDRIAAGIRETEKRIRARGIPLRILPGMEIFMSDFLCRHFSPPDFLSLADTGAYLIEFTMHPSLSLPDEKKIYQLFSRQEEKHFIIAHPERCAVFADNIDMLKGLVASGMLTQVNIGSILGLSGRKAQNAAMEFLRAGLVHFLATDSHGRADRMPPTPSQMAELCRIIGDEAVTTAFRDNPLSMLRGERVQTTLYK